MSNILLVEDSVSFAKAVKSEVEIRLFHKVTHVSSFTDAHIALKNGKGKFALAIVDYRLPDAPEGEAVRHIVSTGIPVIVLAASFKNQLREKILQLGAVDYLMKGKQESVLNIVREVERVLKNSRVKILVVDASAEPGKRAKSMLETGKFDVLLATSGKQAMEILVGHPDTKVALIDFALPDTDGPLFTAKIRRTFNRYSLLVIGTSDIGGDGASAGFLKNGANDFLPRPFQYEDLYARVTQNIELAEQDMALRRAHNTDFLTGLPNRNNFFDLAEKLYQNYKRDNLGVTIALIDLDNFREINGKYGHNMGDAALRQVAGLLKTAVRKSDIACRFGGEEFCLLLTNVEKKLEMGTFEKFRKLVENAEVQYRGKTVKLTASIGATSNYELSLEAMIRRADELLHQAKAEGRNKTVIDPHRFHPPQKGQ